MPMVFLFTIDLGTIEIYAFTHTFFLSHTVSHSLALSNTPSPRRAIRAADKGRANSRYRLVFLTFLVYSCEELINPDLLKLKY